MPGAIGIHLTERCRFRDESGRFLAECDAAAVASAEQLAEALAHVAEGMAWTKSGPVTAQSHGFSAEAVAWGSLAPIQHFGARPHRIEPTLSHGYLAGEDFGPVRGGVNHPGVVGDKFMTVAAQTVSGLGPSIIARNFPK